MELRWVEREEIIEWKDGQPYTSKTIQVLQYRELIGATNIGFGSVGGRWSEWKDVPTVKENDDGK